MKQKIENLLLKYSKTDLSEKLGITRKTLNARIENDTWKKLEIEKINRLCQEK